MEGYSEVLRVCKISRHAIIPTRATPHAAGVDLHSAYSLTILAGRAAKVETDIRVLLPEGTYGRIAPRSGMAVRHSIDVLAGVVDRDYTGNIAVVLINLGHLPYRVRRGDRIAQLICEKITVPEVMEVSALPSTARGARGFGSTGSL